MTSLTTVYLVCDEVIDICIVGSAPLPIFWFHTPTLDIELIVDHFLADADGFLYRTPNSSATLQVGVPFSTS